MEINANTKISALLKYCPAALDAIVSISPKFEKLRNPLLRRLMACRTSIALASKIGGCFPEEFFSKLRPLGFTIQTAPATNTGREKTIPSFMGNLKNLKIVDLDVRPVLEKGEDPLRQIQHCISSLGSGEVLRIINSFEPAPLMSLLHIQGFESHAEWIREDLVETFFFRTKGSIASISSESTEDDWDEAFNRFEGKIKKLDVREMQMPQPLVTILKTLPELAVGEALFVYHKKVPLFLIPELKERNFSLRIKKISDTEIYLLIFRQ